MKKKEATNDTQAPILTKPRRLKLHRFCIVAAAKASSFLHRRGGDSDQTQSAKASGDAKCREIGRASCRERVSSKV